MLNKIALSKEIKSVISSPIPEYLIQQRSGGGGKQLSYLSGSTIIDMLNNAFGYTWSWKETKEWVQESIPNFNQYSKSKEKVNYNGKDGAWEPQGPVAHVKGILTVYLTSEDGTIVAIEKQGYGSKSILGKQNDQESIFKAAGTDALKKAASLFGIGLELYRNEEEQAYFDTISYEDPWTDELTAKYEKEREFIGSYVTDYEVSDEDLQNLVLEITGDSYEITPDNIKDIADYIKTAIESEE